jgi:hypothetical protein
MVFTREFLFDAKEAGGWAIAVSTFVLCAADVAMILMYVSLVWAATFGACNKRFGSFAVWRSVAEAEASGALEEGRAALEGADGGLAAKEVRG